VFKKCMFMNLIFFMQFFFFIIIFRVKYDLSIMFLGADKYALH